MTDWQTATLIKKSQLAYDVFSLTFSLPRWTSHKPGQYYELRITNERGEQISREYSAASSPKTNGVVEFGIQLLKDGEVSPRLIAKTEGDSVELRGPTGGHFVWESKFPEPLILIGGGSGMVPLLAMLREYTKGNREQEVTLIVSAKTIEHVVAYDELTQCAKTYPRVSLHITLTRETPQDWQGHTGRLTEQLLRTIITTRRMPRIYICGPTPFVDSINKALMAIGFQSSFIRTERFGGTTYE